MKILFVNRYFFPDHSATSQILTDLAIHLVECGFSVHVVTSRQRYDEPEANLGAFEVTHGITIHRVWTTRFGRGNLIGRGLDYLTFYLWAAWRLRALANKGDVIVAKTDPPLISVVAAWVAQRRGARLVNWLQDLFPEVALEVGMSGLKGSVGRILVRLRDRSLHRARINVVVGDGMAQKLAPLGVGPEAIRVMYNWADGEAIRPVGIAANSLKMKWELDGKFIVGYSGNMGRAHEFETVLAAAARLKNDAGITFLFVGGGKQREWLEEETTKRRLANVLFKAYQARDILGDSLGVADVHLISLLPELEGLIVPSKFYGIAAAGRPSIFIGDPDGEIARILARHDIGIAIRVGDVDGLVTALLDLKADREKRVAMGARARAAFEAEYDKPIAMAKWEALLREVADAQ